MSNANTLEQEAEKLYPNLSEAEKRLLKATSNGLTAFCGVAENEDNPTYDPANNPANATTWGPDRNLRAALLRWICIDRATFPLIDPRGIRLCAARIIGRLDLSFATVPFPLSFYRCVFSDEAELSYLKIPGLDLSGSLMRAVAADGANIAGDLVVSDGFVSDGGVHMLTTQLGGNLDANGGTFLNPAGHALWADRVKIAGSVFLGPFARTGSPSDGLSFQAKGTVRLIGSLIGGVLNCAGGSFRRPDAPPPAKTATGSATTTASVSQQAGATATPVFALVCDRMKAGGIFFNGSFSAEGQVRLWGADIGGNVVCTGGTFSNANGDAISADGAKIGGTIYFGEGFVSNGTVDLLSCQIGGDIDCRKGSFTKLSLVRAAVKGSLLWSEIKNSQSVQLDLTNTTTGPLQDAPESWPARGNLTLNGFSYSRISPPAPVDVGSRLKWLALPAQFTLQPYQQLARVLKDGGDVDAPHRVLFNMEHKRRQSDDIGVLRHIGSWILRWTIGYGQMPLRALWWLLGLISMGCIFYSLGYLGGVISPSEKDSHAAFKKQGYPPDGYSEFNPLIYSIEHSFPLINLEVKDHWQPGPERITIPPTVHWEVSQWLRDQGLELDSPTFMQMWMWTQTIIGWVLATLFVAGLTGAVKTG